MNALVDEVEKPQHDAAPAHGVERSDAEPVNKKERRSLYKSRVKIYPKLVSGGFRRAKWIFMAVALLAYYLAPWIRWDRGANLPDQAILVDLANRRFYFFFIEIWPQEIYYVTGLLILAALILFLVTSVFGRVWCGYACPQTVWTDLFIAVERFFEGDRAQRIRFDKKAWNLDKTWRRVAKHAVWILIAMATGGAWVFYFADAPTLAGQLLTFAAPAQAYIFIAVLTFTTYSLGGLMREQVCTYMCPWPRIQGAMIDEDTLAVTYRTYRGEPRGVRRKGADLSALGDCVDCKQCVAACPVGIDIRDGDQLECIGCALCIDACDEVMNKVGLPTGLIGYDSYTTLQKKAAGETPKLHVFRPRTLIYAGIISLVGLVMLVTLLSRSTLDVNVLRDRNPLFVQLSDGSIRNGYTVKILNKSYDERRFGLAVEGLEPHSVSVLGLEGQEPELVVGSDTLGSFRVFVAAPRAALDGSSTDIELVVKDLADGSEARYDSVFRGPEK